MDIAVIGTGYVGLVVGPCFAQGGHRVICVDRDEDKIRTLNAGKVPIYEPGLEELIHRSVKEGRLKFSTSLEEGVKNSLLIFIAVGTPLQDDGSMDLTSVFQVAEGIGKAMDGHRIVVNKTTVPLGVNRQVQKVIAGLTAHDFAMVFNPEFLKEGSAIQDFVKPDRIIIGTEDEQAVEIMKELYAPFVRTDNPIIVMDLESAEMTKLAANAILATRISFMNEIANLCEKTGADVHKVRQGIGADKRIGPSFLFPGVGFGGSCLPKDVKALVKLGPEKGLNLSILAAVDRVNEAQKRILFGKIHRHFNGSLEGKSIAVWGLSFKPGTDDMRDAPSVTIINELIKHRATVKAHDPEAMETARRIFKDSVLYFEDYYQALEGAHALALITEWNEFRNPDFEKVKALMKEPVIFDGRNIYDRKKLRRMGFTYYGIGRP